MKNRHLRARLPEEEYRALQAEADAAGLTLSEYVRTLFLRNRQALGQEQFLASIEAKLAVMPHATSAVSTGTELEPLVVESLLLIRELVSERNAQILGRIAHQMNLNFPERKKI